MLRKTIKRLAGRRLSNARFLFAAPLAYPPGHFYSPICDPDEIKHRYRDPQKDTPIEICGIDLGLDSQRKLWESWVPCLSEVRTFLSSQLGRYKISGSYGIGDAIVYMCMLRHLQPSRLIEIGSGSSSLVAMDTFDQFFTEQPHCTFIEPYPTFLRSLLTQKDKETVKIMETRVQNVSPEYFDELRANDVLFIDSTHIVKTASDVLYELFEVLPRLQSGAVVHFHDVFYPFEYPKDWVLHLNYSWNEIYMLRAFLMGNRDWEIIFFNEYFVRNERVRIERDAPEILQNPGGGLWLRRK
jgi:hypothetical protein